MIKMYCDRCGVEIEDKYYTLAFCVHDLKSRDSYANACAADAYSNSVTNMLTKLKSESMYCEKCRDQIIKWAFTL